MRQGWQGLPNWLQRSGVMAAGVGLAMVLSPGGAALGRPADPSATRSTTPVEHVVVIFQENVSFDHYFGTYPNAANTSGSEPRFVARANTPSVNGLTEALLTRNPNLSNPHRLGRDEAVTCDQNHDYTAEQSAADHGAMDKFVEFTSSQAGGAPRTRAQCDVPPRPNPTPDDFAVMDYYDGNTVTAFWNYAQHFAMSDNSFGTTYGPSTNGALNLVAGNTYPVLCGARVGTTAPTGDPDVYDAAGDVKPCPGGISTQAPAGSAVGAGTGTLISDADPYYDACANPKITAAMGGRNGGDLLNSRSVTWGWFEGGFSSPNYKPGDAASFDATTICKGAHYNLGAGSALDGKPCIAHIPAQPIDAFCVSDYSAHHQPFQYYASTSNPMHLPPTSVAAIGKSDRANHQYDLADFWAAVDAGNMPAVSYLKAPKF